MCFVSYNLQIILNYVQPNLSKDIIAGKKSEKIQQLVL
jgi:hypothetical protein